MTFYRYKFQAIIMQYVFKFQWLIMRCLCPYYYGLIEKWQIEIKNKQRCIDALTHDAMQHSVETAEARQDVRYWQQLAEERLEQLRVCQAIKRGLRNEY